MKKGNQKRHCLLFVVPEGHFNGFQKQNAKSHDRQPELDSIAQYVACITVNKKTQITLAGDEMAA